MNIEKMSNAFSMPLSRYDNNMVKTEDGYVVGSFAGSIKAKAVIRAVNLHDEMYAELEESLETFEAIYALSQSYGAKVSIDRIKYLLAKIRG